MLKIFLSSTFRDLEDIRNDILDKLNSVFEGVGMENFTPKGKKSQEVFISDLKKSDIVIFLISPYYGSLIETCVYRDECDADDCSMKTGKGRISYTNCEYNITRADGKLHMTYFIQKGWDPVEFLKDLNTKEIKFYFDNLDKLKENKIFEDMGNNLINHYLEVSKKAWEFGEQIKNEEHIKFVKAIEEPNFIDIVGEHLAENIVEWHADEELNFTDFCDRSSELEEILENINGKIEVYGVGGIGKTAIIQIALLIQRLKGKEIITIGVEQSYSSGSGYKDFRDNELLKKFQHEIGESKITIYDILDALTNKLPNIEEIREKPKNEIIRILQKVINSEKNLIVFIDDFHLSDEDLRDLVEGVNRIILSSRKITGLARKELCIIGIREEDRNDFVNLMCSRYKQYLSDDAKERILKITDGHPVSTELIVRNSEFINFDKFREFNLKNDLKNVNTAQVEKFLKRIVQEILSNDAFSLLKSLSILNTNLESNVDRKSVEESYGMNNINEYFNELIYTEIFKKKKGKEGIYEFSYKHVQDALEDITNKERHEEALNYYNKKREIIGENLDDDVEVLYHQVKSNPVEELVGDLQEIERKIKPVHYGFKRLISVGEDLKDSVDEEGKGHILMVLGNLYSDLGRFGEAEENYRVALNIRNELAVHNSNVYLPEVASTQNNLGTLYADLGRFKEAEDLFINALNVRKELAAHTPDIYLPEVAWTQNNLGTLYIDLGRFEEAEELFLKALKVRKKLAAHSPDTYLPEVARTLNHLGMLYIDLGRFEEAEELFLKALNVRKELATRNPHMYLPEVALTKNDLGTLYADLGRFDEAEEIFLKALNVRLELAKHSPEAYLPDVADTQSNLGVLYRRLRKFEEAEKMFHEALNVRLELAKHSPDAYLPDVASTQNNLGNLYSNLGWFKKAEHAYEEALEIIKDLADKSPDAYNPFYAMVWYNKACLESKRNNKEKSIEFLKKAIVLDKTCIENAKVDDDLDKVRVLKGFQDLLNE